MPLLCSFYFPEEDLGLRGPKSGVHLSSCELVTMTLSVELYAAFYGPNQRHDPSTSEKLFLV